MKKSLEGVRPLLKKLRCRRGFTLLEVLLAITIFSLIGVALFSFYQGALQGWNREATLMDLQQNARIALYAITRELRYALALEGLNDGNTLPLYDSQGSPQQGASKITYTSSDGKRCEIAFNEAKRTVTLKIGSGPPNELAYNVVKMDFFRYIPPGATGGSGSEEICPMILVRLKMRDRDKGIAPGSTYLVQSSVRLQNIVE